MNDLVVVGGGQAGLAAAAHAVQRGLRVVVCEKTDRFGGSASLSAGILWTAPDVETMREVVPDGDPELGRLLVDGLEPAVQRVRDAGVLVTERWYGQMGFGVAYRTDIHALHEHWKRVIVEGGGELRANTPVRSPCSERTARTLRCWRVVMIVLCALGEQGQQTDPVHMLPRDRLGAAAATARCCPDLRPSIRG